MSRAKTPAVSTAIPATRLAKLLVSPDAPAAQARAERARKHFERTRRQRVRAPAALAPQQAPRAYEHDTPTRSQVLNAFVHEAGGQVVVAAHVAVYDEHALAPALLECARRYMGPLIARDDAELALTFAADFPPITNPCAARMYLQQAARVDGVLGAIARDYMHYRAQAEMPEQDDRLASCMMATFAGRLLVYAQQRLGPHVWQAVHEVLDRLTCNERAASRRRAARARELPGASEREQAQVAGASPGRVRSPGRS